MNKTVSSRVTLILFGLVLAVSIFALGMLGNKGLGWFADNDEVDAAGMSVSVNAVPGTVIKVDYYEISSIALSGGENIYTFSKTPIADVADRHLKEYSPIVAERQMLVKITLADTLDAATVRAVTDTTDYVIEDQDDPEVNQANNPLSSVIAFYALSDVQETSEGYVVSSENFQNHTAAHFVTVGEQDGKTQVSFDDNDILIYQTPEGDTDNTIFIMLDYYEESIGYVLSVVNHLMMVNGKTDIQPGENVQFVCDFEIVVSPS